MKTVKIPEMVARALKLGEISKPSVAQLIAESVGKAAEAEEDKKEVGGEKPEGANKFGKLDFPKSKGNEFKAIVNQAVEFCKGIDQKYASDVDLEKYCHKFLESKGFMYTVENVSELAEAVAKKFKSTSLFVIN